MSAPAGAKRILLAGYYGFNNAGDEAVLAGLIKAFGIVGTDRRIELAAHSIDPAATGALHGIPVSHRYRPAALIRSLAGCDLFASGGGSLLQDATSAHSIFYYLATVRIAQMMGKKTMFIAQGIGPLNLPRSRRLTRAVANRLDAITVRDDASAQVLRDIGVAMPPITITADPALLLGPGAPDGRRSGYAVSLRPWGDQADRLLKLLSAVGRSRLAGVPCLAMPMHASTDTPLQDSLAIQLAGASSHAQPPNTTPVPPFTRLLCTAATVEMVIGMRLHALIFAAAAATPSVAIAYDPKVTAFMAQSGQSDAVFDLASAADTDLAETVSRVWDERVDRRERLESLLPVMKQAALRNAQVAIEVLG